MPTWRSRMAILLVILAVWCFPVPSHAAAVISLDTTSDRFHIGDRVALQHYPSGSQTAERLVAAGELTRFKRSRQKQLMLPGRASETWIHLSLENPGQKRRTVILSLERTLPLEATFHEVLPQQTVEQLSAAESPLDAIRLDMPPEERRQLLIRVTSRTAATAQLLVESPPHFEKREIRLLASAGMQCGALLLVFASVLWQSYRLRDFTCLVTASMSLLLMTALGLSQGLPYFKDLLPDAQVIDALIVLGLAYLFLDSIAMPRLLATEDTRDVLFIANRSIGLSTLLPLVTLWLGRTDIAISLFFIILAASLMSGIGMAWNALQLGRSTAPLVLGSRLIVTLLCLSVPVGNATGLALPLAISSNASLLLTLQMLLIIPTLVYYRARNIINTVSNVQRVAVAEAERRARTEFLSKLSHEIRTPMNGILGMTELLEETPLSPMQLDYVRTIGTSGRTLLTVIDDFMDYTNIEAGNMSIDVTPLDLPTTIKECLDMFRTAAEEKQLELVSLIHNDVPTQVKGDPLRIRQVLANLVSNAIKFTEKGDIVITVRKDTDRSPNHVRFDVRDTGPGITKEDLRHLFEEDRQHSQGLGLAISRKLVTMMNGQMGASSEPGQGSTFWFSLPLEGLPEEPESAPFFAGQLTGLRMLVVDDNASCRLVMQQQATGWGMHVSTAVNGKQALALMRSQENLGETFDIIILDHDMPGMNGLELAARIKEDSQINPNLLVVMLSGQNIAPTATASRNAGIRRVLTKPVTGRTLKITLAEELGHLRRIAGASRKPDPSDIRELAGLNVLVAEDHPLSQKVINGMLSKLEVRSTLVVNGRDALQEAKSGLYQLILMDCDMPEMDGFEATRRIRQWESMQRRPETPIIALTAHIMDEHKERSLACGMNAHLSKPVELSELRDTILRWARWAKEGRSR